MFIVITGENNTAEGKIFKFEMAREARQHPIVQYYDAVFGAPEHFAQFFGSDHLIELVERFDEREARRLESLNIDPLIILDDAASTAWNLCLQHAEEPPTDPAEIVQSVVDDRKQVLKGDNHMSNETKKADNKAATPAKEKAPSNRYSTEDVIRMNKDDKGVAFGKDNNPCREKSKVYQRFARYEDGMTVGDALKKGITTGDIRHHEEVKNWITVERAAPAKEEKAAA